MSVPTMAHDAPRDLEIARSLVRAGVPVFVAKFAGWGNGTSGSGFHLPKHWPLTALDTGTVDAWTPGDALCAVMGTALDLLDVDPRNGGDASRSQLVASGTWPRSYARATTPSGGHHEFIAPLGVGSRDNFAPGLDHKGGRHKVPVLDAGRGFAFIAPTVKPSKVTGELVPYIWDQAPEIELIAEGLELDPAGLDLAELIRAAKATKTAKGAVDPGEAYLDPKHSGPIPDGQRHGALIAYAGKLRGRGLSLAEAERLMYGRWQECAQPPAARFPLPWEEAVDKLRDVFARFPPEPERGVATLASVVPLHPGQLEVVPDADPEAERLGHEAVKRLFPALDLAGLWDTEDDEEWIVYPILPARRLVALYSPPKVGKSLLMLEVAACVALGREVLGYRIDRPRHVLYVDFENDPRGDIVARLKAMGYTRDEAGELAEALHVLSFPTMAHLDTPMGGAELMAAAEAYAAEVVVIDTVSRAVGGEENNNDTWLGLYRNTGLKLKAAGISMLRLDHSGKDEDRGMRGGSAKVGDVDAVWKLSRVDAEGTTFKLVCEAARMPIAEKELVLTRLENPLRHKVEPGGWKTARDRQVEEIVQAADAAGLPDDAGRDRVAAVARDAGLKARNDIVGLAVKARKERPKSLIPPVPDFGDRSSPGHLSPIAGTGGDR